MSGNRVDGGGDSRTILWCVPRAISSALAKCLSFVEGSEVWFEPYTFSHIARVEYISNTKVPKEKVPMEFEGHEKEFKKMKELVDSVLHIDTEAKRLPYGSCKRRLEASTAKHVFVKDMAFAMIDGYRQYLPKGYRHTFLIRHPLRSISSYRRAVYFQFSQKGLLEGEAANEKTYDIERDDRYFPEGCFVKELYDLWKYVKEQNLDHNPVIIDGDDLLTKPKETLKAYCDAVGLPYNDTLLEWDGSTEVVKKMRAVGDNVLMDLVNYYGKAMKSSRFLPPSEFPPHDHLTPDVLRCADKVMKYFDEMYEYRLKP